MAIRVSSLEEFAQVQLYLCKEIAYQLLVGELPGSTRTARLRKKRRAMVERWYLREQPDLDRPASGYFISPPLRKPSSDRPQSINESPFPPASYREDDGNLRLF